MDDNQNFDADTTPQDQAGDDGGDAASTVTVQWRNLEWTVPRDRNEWDMHVQFEFEDGRRVRAIFTLLGGGPDGLAKVRGEVYEAAKTAGDLDDCMTHVAEILQKECVNNLP